MRLPAGVLLVRTAYVEKFPVPRCVGCLDPGGFEELCRQWSIRLAEQVAYSVPNQGWGMKRADPTRPISKDTLTQRDGGTLHIFDNLSGVGSFTPTLVADPESIDVTDQVFVPVTPFNHLGSTPPPPSVDGTCAELAQTVLQRLDGIEAQNERLELLIKEGDTANQSRAQVIAAQLNVLGNSTWTGTAKLPFFGTVTITLHRAP